MSFAGTLRAGRLRERCCTKSEYSPKFMQIPALTSRDFSSHGSRKGARPALGAILLFAALGIFVAPWYAPTSQPSSSLSYEFGFNNSVSIGVTGLTLGLLFLYMLVYWRGPQRTTMQQAVASAFGLKNDNDDNPGYFWSVLAAIVGSCFFVSAVYWYTPYARFGEMGYLFPRTVLLQLNQKPYSDFPFPYGPAMLYLPSTIYKLTDGVLSLEQSYLAALLLEWALGIIMLAWCTRVLVPASRQTVVFWVFALLFVNPTLGENYTPLRFMLPISALLGVHVAVMKGSTLKASSHILVAIISFLGPSAAFLISQEMGVAAVLAIVIYFTSLLRTQQRAFAHCIVMPIVATFLFRLVFSATYFDVLFNFGGGYSVPIFPGLGIVLFLTVALFLLPRLAVVGVSSAVSFAPPSVAFCILGGILIVPALSRCDLGHVFLNGLPVLFIAVALASNFRGRRTIAALLASLFLVFGLLGNWIFLFHYSHVFRDARAARVLMLAQPRPSVVAAANGLYFSKDCPPEQGLEPLLAYGRLAVPFGATEDISNFLMLHGQFQCQFHPGGAPDIASTDQMPGWEKEVDSLHTILVPTSLFVPSPQDDQLKMITRYIWFQLLFPAKLTVHHPYVDPDRLLAAHISKKFVVVGEFRDYQIMVRRDDPDPKKTVIAPVTR